MTRSLLIISASPDPDLTGRIADDRSPRKDYLELARAVGGQILFRDAVRDRPLTRMIARWFGPSAAQATLAFLLRHTYDVVFTDAENIGIPLALLFKLASVRRRHVMIGHLLSRRGKWFFFRFLNVHSHIDAIICHASLQRWFLVHQVGVPTHQVILLPYGVDEHFWRPMPMAPHGPICSAGLEFRDYRTLIAAVRGLDLDLTIAAASHWSRRENEASRVPLPPNVQVTALNYENLRDLYARSRFVVVPLHDVEFQAGITTILEAMSMGKAVVVTETRGQRDVVRGKAGLPVLPQHGPPGFPDLEAALRGDVGQTGRYVPPGDVPALRKAIKDLLAQPSHADELGSNGRLLIERAMTLDRYVDRIAALMTGPSHSIPSR